MVITYEQQIKKNKAAFTRGLDAPAAYVELGRLSEKFGLFLFFLDERGGVFNVAPAGTMIRTIWTPHRGITEDSLLVPTQARAL